jgi:CRISPR/Cas system-associated exonuclease Cas4 (RecB family)
MFFALLYANRDKYSSNVLLSSNIKKLINVIKNIRLRNIFWKWKKWRNYPWEIFHKEYISYSRLKLYKTCPRKFELVYLYRFEDKSGQAAEQGKLIHKIIQLYTENNIKSFSTMLRNKSSMEELLSYYEKAKSSSNITYHIYLDEVSNCLKNFIRVNTYENKKVQETEYECSSKIGDYNLKCIIDRIDAGNEVIDYKTGNPRYVQNRQLNTYAYSLCNGNWDEYYLSFQFLKDGEVKRWRYTKALHNSIEKWILETVHEIENTRIFKKRTSRLCDYCSVKKHCEKVQF